jgi:tRNA (guanine-N7-)-methyltransferase
MRLRKIKNASEVISQNSDLVLVNPLDNKGKWKEFFKNDNPIYVEIGMGKGKFILAHAKANPNINYIGIEKEQSVIIRAVEKQMEERLPNLILVHFDATNITDIFSEKEIDKIYLNFSDPWPKTKHSKRRLTYPTFLTNYKLILKDTGDIELKTDNRKLFEYSLVSLNNLHMEFLEVNLDLHTPHENEEAREIITTEYEDRFVSLNHPIYYIKARF